MKELPLDPRRLATILRLNILLTLSAAVFTLVVSLFVARLGWLSFAGCAVLGAGALQIVSLRCLRHGNVRRALAWYAAASWSVALVTSFVVTFQWPAQIAVAIMPMLLAATFEPDRPIIGYAAVSIVVAFAVAAVGLLQDATGLSDEIPDRLKTLVLLLVAPGLMVVAVAAIAQHHRRVNDALAERRAARELAEARAEALEQSRRRLVQATDRARRRIERDLHDGAQSRLIGIDLQLARASRLGGRDEIVEAVADAQLELRRAHQELRDLAHGVYPPVLTQHGVVAALEEAVDRSPIPVRLDIEWSGRLDDESESALYFCALEAIQNAVKHSGCSVIVVRMQQTADYAVVAVEDDGCGLSTPEPVGYGTATMRDRVAAIGGRVEFGSGGGVTVTITVPRTSRRR